MSGVENPRSSGVLPTIFLSYSRADQKTALPIITALEAAGLSVWWDGLLEGGERFAITTEAALENAKAVVVLWSRTSIISHWVHDEATRGRDRKCLVPISIDGAEAPLGFRQFQVIDFSKWRGKSNAPEFLRLLRAVSSVQPEDGTALAPALPLVSSGIGRRRMIVGGITAASIVGGGIALWQSGLLGGASISDNSVAVLSFSNLSGSREQDYFADGLSAEVRAELSRNRAIKVMAQASSDVFKERKEDATDIARKLGVAFLLDGNVRVAGNIVRIAADLINGKTGIIEWSKSFERSMGDIFAVQSEIAGAVVSALTAQVAATGVVKGKTTLGGTNNVAAFDNYLRGQELYQSASDEAGERAALACFDAAIAADPNFAAAYAARARSLSVVASQYGNEATKQRFTEAAVSAAQRAVSLAPDFADAQSTLALTLFQGKLDVRSARKPYDLSRKLGEGNASVQGRFAFYAAATGRFADADDAMQKAMVLDPLNPLVHRAAGAVKFEAGHYAEAIIHIRKALSLKPKLSDAYARIGMAQLALEQNKEARASCVLETHKWSRAACLAIAEKRLGNERAAQAALQVLIDDKDVVSDYQQAQVYSQWGDVEAAKAALMRAFASRDTGLIYARNDPMLQILHTDAAFARLLKNIGFD
jgi:TolB-like protein/Tfp pilus assembly protein PilF